MQEETQKPFEGFRLVIVTIATALATFMIVLDTSIANVAIPAISGDLGVSISQGTWVITAFGAANAISIPMTGFFSRKFGEIRLFIFGISGFIIASFLCGFSSSIEMLIFFRVLQGAVSGSIMPLALSILLRCYPTEKRGLAGAFYGMTIVVAPIMGPILGGLLTDNFSWPWIFYINIPIGLFSLTCIYLFLRDRETKVSSEKINYIGIALLVIAAGSLQMMLDLGKDDDWFSSHTIVILGLIALVSWIVMIIWESFEERPIVNFRFLLNRNYLIATFTMALGYMIYFGSTVLMPLWLQSVVGYTATWAGYAMAPSGVLAIISAPLVGKLTNKMDARSLLTYAFIIFALVAFLRASFTLDSDFMYIAFPQLLLGAATLFFMNPLQLIIAGSVKPAYVADAIAFATFIRTLFGSFSSSIVTTMWDERMAFHHARLVENMSIFNQYAVQLYENLQKNVYALNALITKQAYMMSTIDLFWMSGIISLSLIPLVWLLRPEK